MLPPEVVAYYECGDEQDRLTARVGRLEWARTWDLLQRPTADPGAGARDAPRTRCGSPERRFVPVEDQ